MSGRAVVLRKSVPLYFGSIDFGMLACRIVGRGSSSEPPKSLEIVTGASVRLTGCCWRGYELCKFDLVENRPIKFVIKGAHFFFFLMLDIRYLCSIIGFFNARTNIKPALLIRLVCCLKRTSQLFWLV